MLEFACCVPLLLLQCPVYFELGPRMSRDNVSTKLKIEQYTKYLLLNLVAVSSG